MNEIDAQKGSHKEEGQKARVWAAKAKEAAADIEKRDGACAQRQLRWSVGLGAAGSWAAAGSPPPLDGRSWR